MNVINLERALHVTLYAVGGSVRKEVWGGECREGSVGKGVWGGK